MRLVLHGAAVTRKIEGLGPSSPSSAAASPPGGFCAALESPSRGRVLPDPAGS